MPECQIIYYSASRLAGSAQEIQSQIDAILATSRRNNSLAQVTGALMFSDGYFGQILEGPQAAVEATFERIQQDDRHGNVALIAYTPIPSRSFVSWSMAFVDGRSGASETFGDIGAETGFVLTKIAGEEMFVKLRQLVAAMPAAN